MNNLQTVTEFLRLSLQTLLNAKILIASEHYSHFPIYDKLDRIRVGLWDIIDDIDDLEYSSPNPLSLFGLMPQTLYKQGKGKPMDEQIKKVRKDVEKNNKPKAKKDIKKLLKMDKKFDAKLEKCDIVKKKKK